jgi:hypothetical protein
MTPITRSTRIAMVGNVRTNRLANKVSLSGAFSLSVTGEKEPSPKDDFLYNIL